MSEKRNYSNPNEDVRVLHQNWVQKRSRKLVGKKWKKRWMVVHSNGKLESYRERPMSLTERVNHHEFEIGPESVIRWNTKAEGVSLIIGEKPSQYERVFRVLYPSGDSQQSRWSRLETNEWLKTLKKIALRKRMWYVLQMRSAGQEEQKTSIQTIASPPPRYRQKCVSEETEDSLDEMFDTDCQEFWRNGLKWIRQNIYYEFENSDIEILWHMYAKNKSYLCNDCLELLLVDAFERAYGTKGTHIKRNTHNIIKTISERAYSAKVLLDSNKDGFVDFQDFKLINTRPFWDTVDFLTPILPNHKTTELWLNVFQSIAELGALKDDVIHALWMRYCSKEDGYIYQKDMEEFLEDFMEATTISFPNIDEYDVDDYYNMIPTRAAIALRFLNGDKSAKISLQQFAGIGKEQFWVYVDFSIPDDVEDQEEKKEVNIESDMPPKRKLTREPSADDILKKLSGSDLVNESDILSDSLSSPRNELVIPYQWLDEKAPMPDETDGIVDIAISRLSTIRGNGSMIFDVLEAISETDESDYTESMPDSVNNDHQPDLVAPKAGLSTANIDSLLTQVTVLDRRESLRLLHLDS